MIRVAIAESDIWENERIKKRFARYARENEVQIETKSYSQGQQLLFNYDFRNDIVLIDLELQGMKGMETAYRLRKKDDNVKLFLLSKDSVWALEGYQVQAKAYFLKPLQYDVFSKAMQIVQKEIEADKEKNLLIKTEEGYQRVKIDDIWYFESQKHTLLLHTEMGSIVTRETMKNMEEQLHGYNFVRCKMCYLVNLAYVFRIQGNEVFIGNEKIGISRQKRKTFVEAWFDYNNSGTGMYA